MSTRCPKYPFCTGEVNHCQYGLTRGVADHDGENALKLSNELPELGSTATDRGDVVERHETVHAHGDVVFRLACFFASRARHDGHRVVRRRREFVLD